MTPWKRQLKHSWAGRKRNQKRRLRLGIEPLEQRLLLVGGLGFVEAQFDGQNGVDGLAFAWATAVSPDGKHVYGCSGVANIGGDDDNAISVFSRDSSTGKLTFVQSLFDNQDGGTADGLFACRSVVVSPDGNHVYTAGSSDHKIGIFQRNSTTGALTFLSAVADDTGGVDGLRGAESIAISPDGTAVFVAGRADDAIAAFTRNATTGLLTFEEFEKNGLGGVTGLDRPLSVKVSPDGKHVYAASGSNPNFTGSDAITVFSWDPDTMSLTFVAAYFEGQVQGLNTIDGLDQVTDVAISPDGKHVYAVSEVDTIGGATGNGNDWIAIFERDADTGELTWLDSISGFRICTSLFGVDAESFVVVSPDGQKVYVTKNWEDNGVASFSRNSTTGALTFINGLCELDPVEIGLNLPRPMSIDPSGANLYVAGNASDAIVVMHTKAETVTLPGAGGMFETLVDGTDLVVRTAGGQEHLRQPLSTVRSLVVRGADGVDDTFNIDLSALRIPITFHGGAGGNDSLNITGGDFASVDYNAIAADAGTIDYDGQTITYTGLEPISDTSIATNRTFTISTGGDVQVRLRDDGNLNNGILVIDSNGTGGFEEVAFAVPTGTLTINVNGGADTITVSALDFQLPTSLTINSGGGNDTVNTIPLAIPQTIDGAAHTSGDTLDVVAPGGTTDDGSTVSAPGFAAISYLNFEKVNLILPQIIVVNSTTNVADGNTSSIAALITSPGADGVISLREAITAANNTPNGGASDEIHFNISGAGPHTIQPLTLLPAIADSVILDGYTQPGASANTQLVGSDANLRIVINGSLFTGAFVEPIGLRLNAGSSIVRGVVLNGWDDGFSGVGIQVNSNNNTIEGNFIGTNSTGTAAVANQFGIRIGVFDGSPRGSNNTIGGTAPASRNVVSGNLAGGIAVQAGNGNLITGNYVGTDLAGTSAVPNADGVGISDPSSGAPSTDNTISENLISGNQPPNGSVTLVASQTNLVFSNLIGTNALGTGPLPNQGAGVFSLSSNNQRIIDNVISANLGSGVLLLGNNNRVEGNLIGTDRARTLDLGNGGIGISISGQGNFVGPGIVPPGGGGPVGGGPTPSGDPNTIVFNGLDGIRVSGASSTGNILTRNRILSNDRLGINLLTCNEDSFGVNAHDRLDGDSGPNDLQNAPLLTSATSNGTTTINGSLNSTPNATFRIEFFANIAPDASGFGEGETFIGAVDVTTDGNGDASFSPNFTVSVADPLLIRATATNSAGSTSEFSGPFGIIREIDLGDAPSPYPTLCSANGARHVFVAGNPFLGDLGPDAEADGQPDASATGDDAATSDDEDVNGTTAITLTAGQPLTGLELDHNGGAEGAILNAWIDLNKNGSWDDAGEQFLTDFAVPAGASSTPLDSITLPASATAGTSFVRVRISTQANLTPRGLASDGEVEDFQVTIQTAQQACSTIVINTNDSGAGSFREAINCSNSEPGVQTITFAIPGTVVQTIRPASPLPTITDSVVIDGTSQTGAACNTNGPGQGSNASLRIELDGSQAGTGSNGLFITAGGSTVKGLAVNRFGAAGIRLDTGGNNVLTCNYIGTDVAGTLDLGNTSDGVTIIDSPRNTIGGMTPAARNVISGNDARGVAIFNVASTGIAVQGNFIGTTASGTAALANNGHGVFIEGSSNNLIGGDTAAARNVLSGNLGSGVELRNNAAGNRMFGNFIGVDLTGNNALGNGEYGVGLYNAQDNLIGDTTPTVGTGRGNVISGNAESSVDIDSGVASDGEPSSGNLVRGNIIGLNAAGNARLGNLEQGVTIINSFTNTIGGPTANDGNLISGNTLQGIYIASENVGNAAATGASNNLVQHNRIGTDVSGTLDRGNGAAGVTILAADNNTIRDNVIAFNSLPAGNTGIEVRSGAGNVFLQNSIFSNPGLGIDLAGGSEDVNGVTANDPGDGDDGPNNLQNYPMLASAISDAATVIQGTLNSLASRTFRIEFFANPQADPSGFGEGRTFLGFQNVTTAPSGTAPINFTSPTQVPVGQFITSTATLVQTGEAEFFIETSEFSNAIEVAAPAVERADLSLTKIASSARPNVGDPITFTVVVSNAGPDPASGVRVTDLLPAGLTSVNPVTTQGAYNTTSGVWTVGSLAGGANATLTITAVVGTGAVITNKAEVTASDQLDPDSTPGNNLASEDDQASVTVRPQVADLSLLKTVDNRNAEVGQQVTFTITLANAGPSGATGVEVTDLLPAGLTFVEATAAQGDYDAGSGLWTVGSLAADATTTLTIKATLDTEDPLTNTAEVTAADQFDPDSTPGNQASREDDQFSAGVGLCLTGGPLQIGMNRLIYSCATPDSFSAFVQGTEPGSFFFERYHTTVEVADPEVLSIGIANSDGIAVALFEITEEQANQSFTFQAFQMRPTPRLSNTLTLQAPEAPLLATEVGLDGAPLDASLLPGLLDAAIARWETTGLSLREMKALAAVTLNVAELPGGLVGATIGNQVVLDVDAAGNGWFVDLTPEDDAEFAFDPGSRQGRAVESGTSDQIDALTVVMHELGHLLGLADLPAGMSSTHLMQHKLETGLRRLPVSHTNWHLNEDVNADGAVTPLDALKVINTLNGKHPWSVDSRPELNSEAGQAIAAYLDTNQDYHLTPNDALRVINYLNHANLIGGEGESSPNIGSDDRTWTTRHPITDTILALGRQQRRDAMAAEVATNNSEIRATATMGPGLPSAGTPTSKSHRPLTERPQVSRYFAEVELLIDELADDILLGWNTSAGKLDAFRSKSGVQPGAERVSDPDAHRDE